MSSAVNALSHRVWFLFVKRPVLLLLSLYLRVEILEGSIQQE